MEIGSLTGPVIDNTLAALIGAFIISFLAWSYRRIKDALAERKYTIAGEYRAVYEDIKDDGSVVHEKSNVTLKQKGLKVFADDYDEAMDKDWIFDGEIDPMTGHVTGTYKTKSKTAPGLGVCILEQKKNGVLDGVWAGYDENIEKMDYGRYTLTRRLPVKIRKATKKDGVPVLLLLDQELGEDWIHLDDIEKAIKNDMLYIAECEGNMAGFVLLRMLKSGDLATELKGHDYKVPRDLQLADKHETIGFIEAIATSPDFQRRGVGSKLINKSIEVLAKNKADLVMTLAWKTDHTHLAPTLDNFAFQLRHEFEKFWYEESIKTGDMCPHCGNPCDCATVLYTKPVNKNAA